ncbi:MAG: ROK family protein [Planctomycetota bacterium]|jgi:predicted NBD/HSP70 family sugar kinase|nr:ROK family protein [Planctomycetota bacterium]
MDLLSLARTNRRRVLRYLLRSGGGSRIQIAKNTHISPASLTEISDKLLRQGIVRVQEKASNGKRGRPPAILEISSERALVAVTELARGTASAHLVGPRGKVCGTETERVTKRSFKDHLTAQKKALSAVCRGKWKNVRAISIVNLGISDRQRGILLIDSRNGWKQEPILGAFRCYGKPLFMQNGSRLRALAENWYGAAQDVDDFLYFHLDSGIGGAIVLNDTLLEGPSHGAGEFGHLLTDSEEFCACGERGCLQSVASADAIVRSIGEKRCADFSGAWKLFERRDQRTLRIFAEAIRAIARAIQSMAIVIGPTTVLLGGSMVEHTNGAIVSHISEALARTRKTFIGPLDLRRCALRDRQATTIGAAAYALQELDID